MANERLVQDLLGFPKFEVAELAKTADFTILNTQNGYLFTNAGASGSVTFTLPALQKGFYCYFQSVVDQNLVIARAGSDTIVAKGNASAVSLTYSTSSEKIGSACLVYCNAGGTKWYFRDLGGTTVTVA